MIKEGMSTDEEEFWGVNQSDVRDIRSRARLELIYDTNMRQAHGYGQWKQGQTPAILYRYPAQRFVRDREVGEERPRHAESEGEVRLKSDEAYWAGYQNDPEIGGFGVPWAPFGFHSGMGVRDVSREEARELGLDVDQKTQDQKQAEGKSRLNEGLSASTKGMSPELRKKLIEELRGYKPKDASEAGRQAALRVRERQGRIELDAEAAQEDNTTDLTSVADGENDEKESGGARAQRPRIANQSAIDYLGRGAGDDAQSEQAGTREEARRQERALTRFAQEFGLEQNWQPKSEPIKQGGEHEVFLDDPKRVTKATKDGRFGNIVVDGAGGTRSATPLEYLRRIELQNEVFGDDAGLIALGENEKGRLRLVTSQTFIHGDHPSLDEVSEFMRGHGFAPISPKKSNKRWWREFDGVMVIDAKPENFIKNERGITPIDLVIARMM
ncbi:MAG: hypothetical protein ACQKBY_06075 [Verrucomicrobiales bacterium]